MKHQKTIEQNVFHFIENNKLLTGAKKVLIALSGGSDSVFAVYFLNQFKKKYNVIISAAHVNHNLRGNESKRDEEFCKDLCENLNIDFYSISVNVKTFAQKNKMSIEEAARFLRYEELNRFAKKFGADKIITAHNLDDNTETVLLNLFNGTGLKGIAGIPLKRDNIIRPFLCLSKSEIIQYLKNNNVEFVTDSSNKNFEFTRNYIRHQIVPNLKENINPALDKALLKSGAVIRNQLELINFFTEQASSKILRVEENEFIVSLSELNNYPVELWGEIFKLIFSIYLKADYNFTQFEKVRKIVQSQVGTKIELGRKIIAHRERAKIVFVKRISENFSKTEIRINQKKKVFNSFFSIDQVSEIPKKFLRDSNVEYISGDNIKDKLIIRTWKIGDKIQLLGMKGTKKISDVLTDLKIPSYKRKNQLVLVYKKDIVWIVGKRISEKYKITDQTKIKLKLCLK